MSTSSNFFFSQLDKCSASYTEARKKRILAQSLKPQEVWQVTTDVLYARDSVTFEQAIAAYRLKAEALDMQPTNTGGPLQGAYLSTTEVEDLKKKGLCFKCRKHGHLARDCTTDLKPCGCPCTCDKKKAVNVAFDKDDLKHFMF
jgi:hypothetical protein